MGHFDTVVVGAGSAGCVAAARLSLHPDHRLLVIEAGPDYPTVASLPADIADGRAVADSHDWGYHSLSDYGRDPVPLPRGRLVGGSSAINGTFALRGFPADYEWDLPGWSFSEVSETFRNLETDLDFGHQPWHGSQGPVPIRRYPAAEMSRAAAGFIAAAHQAGHPPAPDHNRPGTVGVGPMPVNTVDGLRMSAALTHLAPVRHRLEIRANTMVDRVEVSSGRAVGVRLADGEVVTTDRVVLAAGTYASPAILLRSGIGPPAQLASNGIEVVAPLEGVGRGVVDHPLSSVDFTIEDFDEGTANYQALLTLASPGWDGDGADTHIFSGGPFLDHRSRAVLALCFGLVKPRSRGRLTLRSSDPRSAPLIDPGHLRHGDDRKRMVYALTETRRVAAEPPLRDLIEGTEIRPAPGVTRSSDLETALVARADTYHHPVGTCRMGDDDGSVVDERGSVYGLDGLWVADASVIPRIPAANTNLPTMMVAERVAGWMADH